jgi:hypothetical protein
MYILHFLFYRGYLWMDNSFEISFDGLIRPHGLAQIKRVFGDIDHFVKTGPDGRPRLDAEFEKAYIAVVKMPFALPLAGHPGECVNSFKCHKLLAPKFDTLFKKIFDSDLEYLLNSFGGCFQFRHKRSGSGLSTHSWGIAIDLNPETNSPGLNGDMREEIIGVFKESGFIWGGDWKRKDPMHFQYCTGY